MPRFRTSVEGAWPGRGSWPAGPIPNGRGLAAEVDGDYLVYGLTTGAEAAVVLPEEWVLRELPLLDVSDPAVLVDLAGRCGRLGPDPLHAERYFPLGATGPWDPRRAQAAMAAPPRGVSRYSGSMVRLAGVTLGLQLLQALVGAWIVYASDGTPGDIVAAWDFPGSGAVGWHRPSDDIAVWSLWQACMDLALSEFHIRVDTGHLFRQLPFEPCGYLYSAGALQLAGIVAQETPLRRCANETCGLPFTRQLGRARHGQHRMAGQLLYCSPRCAKTQGQRERRRAARAARQEGKR